ncbi:MAG: DUF938 domain-containing protein [Alphaproteobacteria bacterium]|jgi:hypothetical protein|nr:DUF938 domain-containing protein [Alphaproteobacteria bacterium]MDP6816278.1 DUF938 domain-containing protein [Alphaproteobacteria bacterium]
MAHRDERPFEPHPDGIRRHAPSVLRNREPILRVLRRVLPPAGAILETASGSGEHVAWMAPRLPRHQWAPSEADPTALPGIDLWAAGAAADNILPARHLDVTWAEWPVADLGDDLVAVTSLNLIHIAPWSVCEGLLAGAARILPAGGLFFLYGPFRRGGRVLSGGDREFDQSLKQRDPDWGLRDLERVISKAEDEGLSFEESVEMPSGNLSVIFRGRAD